MNKILFLFLLTISLACTSKNTTKQAIFLNKEVRFNLVDSIICEGDTGEVFSNSLAPVRFNNEEFIAFDMLTKNLLFFNNKGQDKCRNIDLLLLLNKFKISNDRLVGVLELNPNKFVICSDPLIFIVDSSLDVLSQYNFNSLENSVKYYIIGDALKLKLSSDKRYLYLTVAPDVLPLESYKKGKIMEIDLEKGISRILPIKFPCDYVPGKDYRLFSMPNFTIFKNYLFYIFPGSNYLYKYELVSKLFDSIYILPKYVKINTKDFGPSMADMIYPYLESNNFYQLVNDNKILLLFYWEGKNRNTINRRKGINELNCFFIGYNPDTNEILFDSPLKLNNVLKNVYNFKNGILSFPSQANENLDISKSKFLNYEMVIQ
ncbi:MAG: hypothetical protein EPN88_08495 [Bacteroidetes bacterium]|nr:MAG: hypothetical protein EPN88_08495 [Bacteroidota bacterium]